MRKKVNPEPTMVTVREEMFVSNKNKYYTPILVVLLLIASYLLGMLTTKIQYLENPPGSKQILGTIPANPAGQAQQPTQQQPNAPAAKVNIDNGHLPILGNKDAKVTLVEFSDFQCPFCKQFFDAALTQIKNDYVKTGKIKLTYRHFPLPFHPNAQKAAEASECANEQEKFWEFHDLLFTNQTSWANQDAATAAQTFAGYATQLNMDAGQFSTCLSSGKYQKQVEADNTAGQKAGVSGTPSTFVNGKIIVGACPLATFEAAIKAELANKAWSVSNCQVN